MKSNRAYGVLLFPGIFGGLAIGYVFGQPSAGAVIGLGVSALLALALHLRG